MAGIGSCLQSFLDSNMSADSEEGKCHKVYTVCVYFSSLIYVFDALFINDERKKVLNVAMILIFPSGYYLNIARIANAVQCHS